MVLGAADDMLIAGDLGDDILSDGAGANTLDGGAGEDIIDAGAGFDTISGGAAEDIFVIEDSDAGVVTDDGGNAVVVGDFTAGDSVVVAELEVITDFDADDAIGQQNDANTALNLTALDTASGAFADDTSYFAFGTLLANDTFVVAATGDDAVVFVGADASADTSQDDWFVIDGGAGNLTAADFI